MNLYLFGASHYRYDLGREFWGSTPVLSCGLFPVRFVQLNPFMDTPRVKRFSIGYERVIGCSHLSGLKGAAI